jgi:hypothetical protein
VLLGVSCVLAAAAPASADHSINCTPMGDPACRDLAPIVECVWSNGDGTASIAWGWNNPSSHTLHIDVGAKNKLVPGADGQGQATDFEPGINHNIFVTTVEGTSAEWRLGNNKAATDASTPACPTKPVPMFGSARALLLGVALMFAVALPVLVARRNRLKVTA